MAASGFRPLRKIPYCCLPWESGPCLSPSVADHPLRPATDHRLGGPLPHQPANPTRAPPAAINLSPRISPCGSSGGACGISRSFPRLSPTTGQVPTRYSPVRHSLETEIPRAFDLHVLGMPPAFVLSQDQTLTFIPDPPAGRSSSRASKRSHMREQMATLGRRPRIPSLFSTISNNTPRRALPFGRHHGGRAYKPTQHPASTPDSSNHLRGVRGP